MICGYLLFFESVAAGDGVRRIHNPHISGILRVRNSMPALMPGSGLW
jgi:hypothetical protein